MLDCLSTRKKFGFLTQLGMGFCIMGVCYYFIVDSVDHNYLTTELANRIAIAGTIGFFAAIFSQFWFVGTAELKDKTPKESVK